MLLLINSAASAQTCDLAAEVTRVVTRVESANTLIMDDGTEVVLVGALPPQNLDERQGLEPKWQPAELSRASLEKLVSGKAVALAFGGRRLDRYGRQLAHVFLQVGSDRLWVQGDLIRHGWARAYGLPGNLACGDALLDYERRARLNKQGHWMTGIFQDRDASEPRELAKFRDTFQTIEGRIAKATRIRGQTVLDFGPDGRTDFSVWLAPRRQGRRTLAQYVELVGKRVRVRGWIEMRRGPRLTLDDDSFIEILTDEAAPSRESNPNTALEGGAVPIPALAR